MYASRKGLLSCMRAYMHVFTRTNCYISLRKNTHARTFNSCIHTQRKSTDTHTLNYVHSYTHTYIHTCIYTSRGVDHDHKRQHQRARKYMDSSQRRNDHRTSFYTQDCVDQSRGHQGRQANESRDQAPAMVYDLQYRICRHAFVLQLCIRVCMGLCAYVRCQFVRVFWIQEASPAAEFSAF